MLRLSKFLSHPLRRREVTVKAFLRSNQLLFAIAIFGLIFQQRAGNVSQDEARVEFHIAADRTAYAPGSRMSLRSFVLNPGSMPVHIARNFSSCTGWDGYVNVQILNSDGRNVRKLGCAAEYLPMSSSEIMHQMKNSELWILLGPNEIYGTIDEFELPKEKGVYHIQAELVPPRLSEEQKQTLNENQMPFLSRPITAPPIKIEVK
jgi:hypothetical protein